MKALDHPMPAPAGIQAPERLHVEAHIVGRLNALAWLIDHGRANEAPRFFAEDAVIDGAVPTVVGGNAIRAAMNRRATLKIMSRHVQSNFLADWRDDDELTMHHVLTIYRTEMTDGLVPPVSILDVVDRVRRGQDGEWRIAHRHVSRVFGGH